MKRFFRAQEQEYFLTYVSIRKCGILSKGGIEAINGHFSMLFGFGSCIFMRISREIIQGKSYHTNRVFYPKLPPYSRMLTFGKS